MIKHSLIMKYIIIGLISIGGPLITYFLTYQTSQSDMSVRVPVTSYSLENTLLTYKTTLNSIEKGKLVKTPGLEFDIDDKRPANIHLVSGPHQSAYAYMMTNSASAYKSPVDIETYHVKGRVKASQSGDYDVEYGLETITLPVHLSNKIRAMQGTQFKAVWGVRKTGHPYFSGLEIGGEYTPYQFSLKDVLFERTQ